MNWVVYYHQHVWIAIICYILVQEVQDPNADILSVIESTQGHFNNLEDGKYKRQLENAGKIKKINKIQKDQTNKNREHWEKKHGEKRREKTMDWRTHAELRNRHRNEE